MEMSGEKEVGTEKKRRQPTPFGHAVRIRLAELGIRQTDLAKMLGTSDAMVTYLIYGDRPDVHWQVRILEALDMQEDEG